MRVVFLIAAILFAAAANGYSQHSRAVSADEDRSISKSDEEAVESGTLNVSERSSGPLPIPEPVKERNEKTSGKSMRYRLPVPYIRPAADVRFKNYVDSTFGPESLIRYAAVAGLLTYRKSPKEWGAGPGGYARRFLNVAAKNTIRTTATYGLDELLKVDSTFYLSRDRSVAARFRNSVFSAVTARNRRGHRVIGVPRHAASFAAEVISSTGWYPRRYDQDHGFKGGAISIGITTGVNLFREFVLKR